MYKEAKNDRKKINKEAKNDSVGGLCDKKNSLKH